METAPTLGRDPSSRLFALDDWCARARDRGIYHLASLADDCVKVRFVLEALGVDFVDRLCPRRSRREPAAGCDHLKAVNRSLVAGGVAQLHNDRLAGQTRLLDGLGRQGFQPRFLFGCRGRIDARVAWRAEFRGQLPVVLAGVFAGASRDLGRQQVHDRTVLVSRPYAAIMAQETGAGAFLAAKAARAVEQPTHEPFEADGYFIKPVPKLLYHPVDHATADQRLADRRMGRPVRAMRQQVMDGNG